MGQSSQHGQVRSVLGPVKPFRSGGRDVLASIDHVLSVWGLGWLDALSREKSEVQVIGRRCTVTLRHPDGITELLLFCDTEKTRSKSVQPVLRFMYLRAPGALSSLPLTRSERCIMWQGMMKQLIMASLPRSSAAVVVAHAVQPIWTTETPRGVAGEPRSSCSPLRLAVQQRWLSPAHTGVCRRGHATSAGGH